MGVCNCSMFCCTLLYVYSSIAIILMGKRELIALLNLSSWCLVMVERLFLAVPRGCQQFVIVVFPDQTHLLFLQSSQWGRESWMLCFICLVSRVWCLVIAVWLLLMTSRVCLQFVIAVFPDHLSYYFRSAHGVSLYIRGVTSELLLHAHNT